MKQKNMTTLNVWTHQNNFMAPCGVFLNQHIEQTKFVQAALEI